MKFFQSCFFSLGMFLIYAAPVTAADQVDPETFVGWRLYHDTCVTCHGVGGSGSELAPDLTESLNRLSREEFRMTVMNRYLIEIPREDAMSEHRSIIRNAFLEEIRKEELSDATGAPRMPEWQHNPIVSDHVDYIYRYLKARSTGAIGPDHPEIIKE